jgi:hypothetical protein
VNGTAASARTANDAASSFFVFDIRVTSLRLEPLRTRLRAFGGSLTADYCDAQRVANAVQFMVSTLGTRLARNIGARMAPKPVRSPDLPSG